MATTPLHERAAELVASVRGSTTTDAPEVAAFLAHALAAQAARAAAVTATNQARAATVHVALDAAVMQVLGMAPLTIAHGVPVTIQKRIRTAVRAGTLSSTLGSSNEPGIPAIRKALRRIECRNTAAPELGEHPESVAASYALPPPRI